MSLTIASADSASTDAVKNEIKDHLESMIRGYEISKMAHAGNDYARAANAFNFSLINSKLEAFVPHIQQTLNMLTPILPPQVPAVVNALLALYVAIDQNVLNPKPA